MRVFAQRKKEFGTRTLRGKYNWTAKENRPRDPQDALHTLCAFANDFHNLGGGQFLLGVAKQNGRPGPPTIPSPRPT